MRRPIGDVRVRSLQIRERRDVMNYMSANLRDDYGIDVSQYIQGRSPKGSESPFSPATPGVDVVSGAQVAK
jgi:hypothetical protein